MTQLNLILFIVMLAGCWTALEGWSRGRPGSLAIIEDLEDRIYLLQRELEKFELNVTRYKNTEQVLLKFIKEFNERRDQAASSAFIISGADDQRKYYLKKHVHRFDYETAQAWCALFDGYLAEVSEESELTFIKNFLSESSVPDERAVYFGPQLVGTAWQYGRSSSPIGTFPWSAGFPQNGLTTKCACLKDRQMKQCNCPETSTNENSNSHGRSFLCEIHTPDKPT